MVLVKVIAFVALKILHSLVTIKNIWLEITADKIRKGA